MQPRWLVEHENVSSRRIMESESTQNHGHLVLARGGQYGRVSEWKMRRGVKRLRLRVPLQLEQRLNSRMHFAALKVRGAQGETPSRQWQAIKETTHRPWSILARRLVEAKQAGVPREQVEGMALALGDWIARDLYGEQNDPPKAA